MEFRPIPPDERLFEWRRAYAVLDSIQPDAPEPGERCQVYLDMVDADWLDDRRHDAPLTAADADAGHVSILSIQESYGKGPLTGEGSEGETWWEIAFDGQNQAQHYASLFHLPLERRIGSPKTTNADNTGRLAALTSLDEFPDAADEDIESALLSMTGVEEVAVYDVGHGNANGILQDGRPRAYFDLGGGVLGNTKTYPTSITFCFSQDPCVVLSHWDWDHWASGKLHTPAHALTWIVPRQTIGPTHRAFASLIATHGTLLIWPPGSPPISSGRVQLVGCTGTSRNDSGIAAIVDAGNDADDDASRPCLLLPADAAYKHIPTAFTKTLTGLVASHHGGRFSGGGIPGPAASHAHKLVFSYGDGNTYGHPTPASVTSHRSAGWISDEGTARHGTARGHVLLNGAPPRYAACSGARCTLDLTK